MKMLQNIAGGLVGAIALNLIHEAARHVYKDAPRVHKVGEEAITNLATAVNVEPPTGDNLYLATLAGDIVSNAIYYSAAGAGDSQHAAWRGAGLGLIAGLGAIEFTKPLGLDDQPVTRTETTKVLTVAWYVLGGLVAGLTVKALRSN